MPMLFYPRTGLVAICLNCILFCFASMMASVMHEANGAAEAIFSEFGVAPY